MAYSSNIQKKKKKNLSSLNINNVSSTYCLYKRASNLSNSSTQFYLFMMSHQHICKNRIQRKPHWNPVCLIEMSAKQNEFTTLQMQDISMESMVCKLLQYSHKIIFKIATTNLNVLLSLVVQWRTFLHPLE